MKILKFGGSSIADPDRIKNVMEIIRETQKQTHQIAVVVSAFGGVTDKFIEMAKLASERRNDEYKSILEAAKDRHKRIVKGLLSKHHQGASISYIDTKFKELKDILHGIFLTRELTGRTLDYIMSFGERLSAFIISETLGHHGIKSEYLDARQLIMTDDTFNDAKVDQKTTYRNIREYLRSDETIRVITGFIGSTEKVVTTTIGRSGSDFTASLFAAALRAEEVEIWTDVDGVMTADPRKVSKAFSIDTMSYEEVQEMSHFGAKVIHPPAIQPAMDAGIPLRIKNTMNPAFPGTVITERSSKNPYLVRGITSIDDVALLNIEGAGMVGMPGITQRLFAVLGRNKINIILISQASSEHSICLAIAPKDANTAKKAIEEEFAIERQVRRMDDVHIERDLSIIAVVGDRMKKEGRIPCRLFKSLSKRKIGISAIAQGSSERNISLAVRKEDEIKALNTLHESFFFPKNKPVHIFMVGTGLIGSTMLKQIKEQRSFLLEKHFTDIHINALADVKKMVFSEKGIGLSVWQEKLQGSEEKMDMESFISRIIRLDLPGSVFVDCTTSESVTEYYEKILKASIHIVTPNKKSNSGAYNRFEKLRDLSNENNIAFNYETQVGAALPVIAALKDLVKTGDEIETIEGIFSGTLSYIFNTFDGTAPFSEIVRMAKEKGYTEPDPRDDLNGMDVARKILILARETGLKMEINDIEVEDLVPKEAGNAEDVEDFFRKLKKHDHEYQKKVSEAKKEDRVLRYIAKLENRKAKVSLQTVGKDHPFYSMAGSDNIVSFKTKRYCNTPFVIKGPGAGAEVTAAGVLSDILRIF